MIKYFHELTEAEFATLPNDMTWEKCAELYPQPLWCKYPGAVEGVMGCWSLMGHLVTGEDYCNGCECYSGETKVVRVR